MALYFSGFFFIPSPPRVRLPRWLSVKNPPPRAGGRVLPLGQGDPEEQEMATQSSVLAWEFPWTEEPGRLQRMGSQRVGRD